MHQFVPMHGRKLLFILVYDILLTDNQFEGLLFKVMEGELLKNLSHVTLIFTVLLICLG